MASGRRTIQYPFTSDAQVMRSYLFKAHPGYIVLDDIGFPQTSTYLMPVLRDMADMLEAVYTTPEPINSVLRFSPQGAAR
jgi:hypothetical protein